MLHGQKTVDVDLRVLKRDVALVKSSALEARPAVSLFNLYLRKENAERYLK
jgi:hypothetical protein